MPNAPNNDCFISLRLYKSFWLQIFLAINHNSFQLVTETAPHSIMLLDVIVNKISAPLTGVVSHILGVRVGQCSPMAFHVGARQMRQKMIWFFSFGLERDERQQSHLILPHSVKLLVFITSASYFCLRFSISLGLLSHLPSEILVIGISSFMATAVTELWMTSESMAWFRRNSWYLADLYWRISTFEVPYFRENSDSWRFNSPSVNSWSSGTT